MSISTARRLCALLLVVSAGCDAVRQVEPPAPKPPAQADTGALVARGKTTTANFLQALPHPAPTPRPLPFEAALATYYGEVAAALKLSDEERDLLRQNGFVIVDHDQRYTFATAYLGVYTRDLPVLITTDSILHAYHRSYDGMLRALEETWMAHALETMLIGMRGSLGLARKQGQVDEATARDVDDYLRVALALLVDPESDTFGMVTKSHHEGDDVETLLDAAVEAKGVGRATIRGHTRTIDFTQFTPRGHYTRSPVLSRYFRAMMWLGRSDTGFWLTPGSTVDVDVDADRELRAASLVARLVNQGTSATSYREIEAVYRQFVGESDNLTVGALAEAAAKSDGSPEAMRELLRQHPDAEQRIQSSVLFVPPDSGGNAELPMLFQVFGQRFTLDGSAMHELVHDRIVVDGVAVPRMMVSPLDVAASLGNDEAARLLEPELMRWAYAPKLASVRKQIESLPASTWESSLSTGWLAALRTLHPSEVTGTFPAAMNTTAWQRKMLGTELASWSELRHDNVLVTKESYSMGIACEYPYGYVEPYPAFYRTMAQLARSSAKALTNLGPDHARYLRERISKHFDGFASTMHTLEKLATKELAAEPFSEADRDFLKRVAFNQVVGCGGPELSGWYASLYFGDEDPKEWQPTVAAVHSAPRKNGLDILHVGVGDARYLVAVIDSEDDLRTYVGPVYSYYEEVLRDERLTDEAWRARLRSEQPPESPAWFRALGGKTQKRDLGPPAKGHE